MSKRSYQFYLYICIIVIYLAVTFISAPNVAVLHQYHLSTANYRLILATVAIPLALIWLIAFYGYAKLQRYADTIKKNKDGRPVAALTKGVMLLVFQLPVTSVAGNILGRIAQDHPGFVPSSVIVSHYLQLALPLLAFLFVSYGARGLTEVVKQRPSYRATIALALILTTVGGGFTYFVFRGVPPAVGVSVTNQARYYLPNWLTFFTIVVPYIFTWFIGLLAAYEVYLFNRKVAGTLYRRGWEWLAAGLGWIISTYIIFQYVTTLSSHLTRLKVNALLLVVYALLIVLAGGFAFVAMGAKKLQKIEEV